MSTCTFHATIDGDLANALNWDAKPIADDNAVLEANATSGIITCATLDTTGYSCVCSSSSAISGTITVDTTHAFSYGTKVVGIVGTLGGVSFAIDSQGIISEATAGLTCSSMTLGDLVGSFASGDITCTGAIQVASITGKLVDAGSSVSCASFHCTGDMTGSGDGKSVIDGSFTCTGGNFIVDGIINDSLMLYGGSAILNITGNFVCHDCTMGDVFNGTVAITGTITCGNIERLFNIITPTLTNVTAITVGNISSGFADTSVISCPNADIIVGNCTYGFFPSGSLCSLTAKSLTVGDVTDIFTDGEIAVSGTIVCGNVTGDFIAPNGSISGATSITVGAIGGNLVAKNRPAFSVTRLAVNGPGKTNVKKGVAVGAEVGTYTPPKISLF